MSSKGCRCTHKAPLNTYDWLSDIPHPKDGEEYIEVQFKNTRKGYFLNRQKLDLNKGDMVVVESYPGYDLGMATLTGPLVVPAMLHHRHDTQKGEPRTVLRIATAEDLNKQKEAKAKEYDTMIRSRRIAEELGLEMKIGDVEYQGDGTKAIFYYIADGRVDFRQLIRVLADAFKIRIEMKQIGARQEAGRIGGIGSCGRPLCCSSWMNNFVSVGTTAARLQDLSLNPQKLTGQCAKLKCCLNHEVDVYAEAKHRLPHRDTTLETEEGTYYQFKVDILKRQVTYSKQKNLASDLITISSERAFAVLSLNKKGIKPETLEFDNKQHQPQQRSADILGDSLTRFDSNKRKRNKKKRMQSPSAEKEMRASSSDQSGERDQEQGKEQNASDNNSKPFEPSKRVSENGRGPRPVQQAPTGQRPKNKFDRSHRRPTPNEKGKSEELQAKKDQAPSDSRYSI